MLDKSYFFSFISKLKALGDKFNELKGNLRFVIVGGALFFVIIISLVLLNCGRNNLPYMNQFAADFVSNMVKGDVEAVKIMSNDVFSEISNNVFWIKKYKEIYGGILVAEASKEIEYETDEDRERMSYGAAYVPDPSKKIDPTKTLAKVKIRIVYNKKFSDRFNHNRTGYVYFKQQDSQWVPMSYYFIESKNLDFINKGFEKKIK